MKTPHSVGADVDEVAIVTAAQHVLDTNRIGSSTVPSRSLYPHQWSWDSAFIAVGRSWYDEPRARLELVTLFDAQWANGMVPHIVFNPAVPDGEHFPGPTSGMPADRQTLLVGSGRPASPSRRSTRPQHSPCTALSQSGRRIRLQALSRRSGGRHSTR